MYTLGMPWRSRYQKDLATICAGLGMVAVSVFVFVAYHNDFSSGKRVTVDAASTSQGISCVARPTLRRRVRVSVEDPFVLELKSSDPSTLKREYRVSGVGLEVQPNEWLPLAVSSSNPSRGDFAARWSARAMAPGEYTPILSVKSRDGQAAEWSNRCEASIQTPLGITAGKPDATEFTIIVLPTPVYYAQKFSPYVGGFLGSLMTLPGILALIRERRSRMKAESLVRIAEKLPNA